MFHQVILLDVSCGIVVFWLFVSLGHEAYLDVWRGEGDAWLLGVEDLQIDGCLRGINHHLMSKCLLSNVVELN